MKPETLFKYQIQNFEKVPVRIWDDPQKASEHVARSIALAIRQKQQEGEDIVLGLATGSSPIKVYEELVRLHKAENLSFYNVITFNLDEYYPMRPEAEQSYVKFMNDHLFNHIDIDPNNIHIPDGTIPLEKVENYCKLYEDKIDAVGGIDIQLLGIGRTGHIGFNEPGSRQNSVTRMVRLDGITRRDAIEDFVTEDQVPYRAITMGIRTILKARKVFLLAWGSHKAEVVKQAVEDEISAAVPATYLQEHPNVQYHIDQAAAEELTKSKTPWLVGMCKWNEELVVKAVTWLSLKLDKAILKLTAEDYGDNGLSELVLEYDSAYNINIKVFNHLQHTITGWPGGKPNADDTNRPERATPKKKKVLIFSPHPDDDVISMGGTFLRLVDQGHDVHVAYQTSGNIAVHDYDARRFLEFYKDFTLSEELNTEKTSKTIKKIQEAMKKKKFHGIDSGDVRLIKGLIRKGEARAGARFCGIDDDHIHFLDMPFYETGKSRKKPLSANDIKLIVKILDDIKPHQVYAAGDLADPHGTHRVCLNAIQKAFEQLKGKSWMKDCWLWLYRGAWHEWPINEIEMAIPLSPNELLRKRKAIFMHQSQKDQPPFPGSDTREFWQRAEDRNRETAETYRKLGLAEYEAIEAFARWKI